MTDKVNAERLRREYLRQTAQKRNYGYVNICRATPNWNGCDYCDVYSGAGLECWKQNGKHWCIRCERMKRNTL